MAKFADIVARCVEPVNRRFHRAVVSEFVGTFLIVFFGLLAMNTSQHSVDSAYWFAIDSSYLCIACCFGSVYVTATHTFGHHSGAHFNPAVSFAFCVVRLVTPLRAMAYIMAQMTGAVLATFFLRVSLNTDNERLLGRNYLSGAEDNQLVRSVVTEYLLSTLLILTMLAALDPNKTGQAYDPVSIGVAVTIIHIVALPITNCGTNPARSFGLWLFDARHPGRVDYREASIMLVPYLGSLQAVLLYMFWFADHAFKADEIRPLVAADEVVVIEGGIESEEES